MDQYLNSFGVSLQEFRLGGRAEWHVIVYNEVTCDLQFPEGMVSRMPT